MTTHRGALAPGADTTLALNKTSPVGATCTDEDGSFALALASRYDPEAGPFDEPQHLIDVYARVLLNAGELCAGIPWSLLKDGIRMNRGFVDLLRASSDAERRLLAVGPFAVGRYARPRAGEPVHWGPRP